MRTRPFPLSSLLALAALLGLSACAQTTINLDRDGTLNNTEGDLETLSPYGFADRWGEPDQWINEGDTKRGLTMRQIWNCADGRYREITWRMVQRSAEAGLAWTIVNDVNREGKCDEPEAAADSTASDSSDAPPDSASAS